MSHQLTITVQVEVGERDLAIGSTLKGARSLADLHDLAKALRNISDGYYELIASHDEFKHLEVGDDLRAWLQATPISEIAHK